MNFQKIISCAFIIILGISNSSFSQEKIGTGVGALFLTIINSSQSNGMGNVTVNLINEESVFSNPGAISLFHMDKFVSISLPHKTDWLKQLADDMYLNSSSISTGINSDLLPHKFDDIKFAISLAVAKQKLDYPEVQEISYEIGNTEYFDNQDKATIYSISLGVKKIVNLGVGLNYKRIISKFSSGELEAISGKANVFDIGAIVEIPLHELINLNLSMEADQSIRFEFTPTIAFVYANLGNEIKLDNGLSVGKTPKRYRFGIGLKSGIKIENIRYGSLIFIYEKEKDLVAKNNEINKIGIEFGLADFAFYRLGKFKDSPPDRDVKTKGYGFSLKGIIKIFGKLYPSSQNNKISKYLTNHLNVSYDVAKWKDDDSVLDETKFVKIIFSI